MGHSGRDLEHTSFQVIADAIPRHVPHGEGRNIQNPPIESTSDLSPTPYTSDLSPTPYTSDLLPPPYTSDLSPPPYASNDVFVGPDADHGWQADLSVIELAQWMVENGADLNATDGQGRPVVLWVMELGDTRLARLIFENGADLNAIDGQGRPVLLWAMQLGHTSLARWMVEKGADLNATDDRGRPVVLWAMELGHTRLARLISKKSADLNATNGRRGRPAQSKACIARFVRRAGGVLSLFMRTYKDLVHARKKIMIEASTFSAERISQLTCA